MRVRDVDHILRGVLDILPEHDCGMWLHLLDHLRAEILRVVRRICWQINSGGDVGRRCRRSQLARDVLELCFGLHQKPANRLANVGLDLLVVQLFQWRQSQRCPSGDVAKEIVDHPRLLLESCNTLRTTRCRLDGVRDMNLRGVVGCGRD